MMVSEYCCWIPHSCSSLSLQLALYEHKAGRPILTTQELHHVIEALLDAVHILQQRDLYHCDIKSNNVMLQFRNHGVHPVLIDYGLVCRSKGNGSKPMHDTDNLEKSLAEFPHVCPELYKQPDPLPSSDVYSVALIVRKIGEALKRDDIINLANHYRELESLKRPSLVDFRHHIRRLFDKPTEDARKELTLSHDTDRDTSESLNRSAASEIADAAGVTGSSEVENVVSISSTEDETNTSSDKASVEVIDRSDKDEEEYVLSCIVIAPSKPEQRHKRKRSLSPSPEHVYKHARVQH